jgi:hypothetical protein
MRERVALSGFRVMGSRVASARRAANAGRLRHRPAIRRLHLALLQSAGRQRARGFALPIVILAVLVMSVGSLAIANRSSLGSLGTVYQSLGFDAQEAAEIGMNRIISELNRSENRGLLRSKGSAVESALWTSSDATSYHASRCPDVSPPDLASNPSLGYPSSGSPSTYNTIYIRSDGSISSSSSSGATRAYRLVSVTRRPESELQIFQSMSAPAGTVTVQVEGQALSSGGAISARTTLQRVFQLVPKCCGTSFGGNHGNVDYRRPASDSTAYVCLPDNMLGMGLVGGTGSTTGAFTLKGSVTVNSSSGQAISTVYCLADSTGYCTISDNGKSTDIDVLSPRPANFPAAKTYPGGNTSSPAPGVLQAPSSPRVSDTNAFLYCINSSCSQWAVNADASSVPANCMQTSTETHCYYAQLSYKNDDVYFLTKSRKLRLYFVSAGLILDGGSGNATLNHCKTISAASTPTCSGTRPKTADLAVFGCNSCASQTFDWRGTPDVLDAFVYVPNGSATVAGNATFQGVLWTNKIDSLGNVSWVVPGSGLRDVLELMGLLAAQGQSPTSNPLLFDYVARATSSFRWLNP